MEFIIYDIFKTEVGGASSYLTRFMAYLQSQVWSGRDTLTPQYPAHLQGNLLLFNAPSECRLMLPVMHWKLFKKRSIYSNP